MNPGRTVFAQLLQHLPRYEFDKCVRRYGGNYRIRRFPCYDQLLCLAFAQLTYRESLRDIETCLNSHHETLYHVGFRGPVSRSTLADANEQRDYRIYQDFGYHLIVVARSLYRGEELEIELEHSVYALDSTTIDLCLPLFPWATFRKTKGAIKLHTLLDLRGSIPTFISLTPGSVHDVKLLDTVPLQKESIVTLDRGYTDFRRLYAVHRQPAYFVIRAKSNLRYRRLSSRPVKKPVRADPDHRAHDTPFPRGLSGGLETGLLRGARHEKASRVSDQHLHDPGTDRGGHLQVALGNRVVLQVDQAAPADQVLLWNVGQCRQDPDLGGSVHLPACGHPEKTASSVLQSAYPAADPGGQSLREKAHRATGSRRNKANYGT